MWIILEGPDGSGKSTLQTAIAEAMNENAVRHELTHLGPPRDETSALIECLDEAPFSEYSPMSLRSIVSDRHHWGCPVYGPIYRPHLAQDEYGDFGVAGWRFAESWAAARGAATFLITVDPDVARERIGVRGDDYIDVKHLEELLAKYEWLSRNSITFAHRWHNLEREKVREVAEFAVMLAAEKERHCHLLRLWPSYLGAPEPKSLILFSGIREQALEMYEMMDDDQWRDVGLVDGSLSYERLEQLVDVLGGPRVIVIDGRSLQNGAALATAMNGVVVSEAADAVASI